MTDANQALVALDHEITTRFAKRTGTLEAFLKEWIRLDESQDKLFKTVGANGETYFQYKLGKHDTQMGLALAHMCAFFAESTDAQKAIDFLQKHDNQGNDIWHYLAATLARNENEEGLTIAKLLIQLELSYIKRNEEDETALGKLLVPECKWTSINAMIQVKEITLDELVGAFSEGVKVGREVMQQIICGVLVSDLEQNDGKFTQMLVEQANNPAVEDDLKERTCAVLFDYSSGKRMDTVFMKIAEVNQPLLFEKVLDLLDKVTASSVREIAARDPQLAKAKQQQQLYQRLGKQNRANQNALFKAVQADRHQNITYILGALSNENIVLTRKNEKGETIQQIFAIDDKSAARQNPRLALLLQQDSRGNTVYHLSALMSRVECLRKLFVGLSMMDSYMIAAKIPNKFGLTCSDFLDVNKTRAKLAAGLKAGQVTKENAQAIFGLASKVKKEVQEFLGEQIKRAEEVIARTGGMSEAKPTFDIRRIPTIALLRLERNGPQQAAG